MLLTNRLFERTPPDRDAKNIYIFCEGVKTEFQYFQYFKEMDSRINVEVYPLSDDEDNSPRGLLEIAKNCIIVTEERPRPPYEFLEGDEVWIVLDRDLDKLDSRLPQIAEVEAYCQSLDGWELVMSNPCFEVWLYYHHHAICPSFDKDDICSAWKKYVNKNVPGGFDTRKHPILIADATQNSETEHRKQTHDELQKGNTEVYRLGRSILSILQSKIDKVREAYKI